MSNMKWFPSYRWVVWDDPYPAHEQCERFPSYRWVMWDDPYPAHEQCERFLSYRWAIHNQLTRHLCLLSDRCENIKTYYQMQETYCLQTCIITDITKQLTNTNYQDVDNTIVKVWTIITKHRQNESVNKKSTQQSILYLEFVLISFPGQTLQICTHIAIIDKVIIHLIISELSGLFLYWSLVFLHLMWYFKCYFEFLHHNDVKLSWYLLRE